MTYSQRLSGGASLSDILYWEQQIDQCKEEQVAAVEKLKRYEQEWTQMHARLQKSETVEETEEAKALAKKIADEQACVNMLTSRLEELENTLEELVD
nr:hypothetical protein [Paenibacillus xylanexedens]